MRHLSLTFLLLGLAFLAVGQVNNDYRTINSGTWNTTGIWQRYQGGSWQAAAAAPSGANQERTITISAGHDVSIPNGLTVSVDDVVINGTLTVDAGGTFSLNRSQQGATDLTIGAGGFLRVDGTFNRNNTSLVSNTQGADRISFGAGATYNHLYTAALGDMFPSTWHETSNFNVTAISTTTPLFANDTWNLLYGNFTWSCPQAGNTGQRALVDLAGWVRTIRGDLNILQTGNNALQFGSSQDFTLEVGQSGNPVGGNITVSGTARVIFNVSGAVTVNVHNNISFSSTAPLGSFLTTSGNTTVNVYGQFNMTAGAGRLRFASTGTTGNGTINLYDDFTLNSGILDENGTGNAQGNLRFLKTGTQVFTNTGSIDQFVNYYISPQTTLDMGTSPAFGQAPSAFHLDGGTVILRSLDGLGAIAQGSSAGNIRTPDEFKQFSAGSTLIYAGAGLQYMGSGHPLNSDITTIIDNPAGVFLGDNAVINGHLILESGNLSLNDFELSLNNTFTRTNGYFAGTGLSSLIVGGTVAGDGGVLAFDPSASELGFFTIDREGAGAFITMNGDMAVNMEINLVRGNLSNTGNLTIGNALELTRYETSAWMGNAPVIAPGDVYHVTYRTTSEECGPFAYLVSGSELSGDPAVIGNFTIDMAQDFDIFELDKDIAVNGIATFVKGTFSNGNYDLLMNGPDWYDESGLVEPAIGTVIFNTTTIVDGLNHAAFSNLRVNGSASVEFIQDIRVYGNLEFVSGSTVELNQITTTFAGGANQTASPNGGTFYNVTIEKVTGTNVTLQSGLNLTGLLRFNSLGNVELNSNGHLRLVSTSDGPGSGTAAIYQLLNNNRVTNTIEANRFMSGEGRIYRYLSSPISNGTVAQWKDDFSITGTFSDPSPTATICGFRVVSNSPSLFYYDETVAGEQNLGYFSYPLDGTTTASSPLEPGRGYAAFIRICDAPTVIDYFGTINAGDISLPVDYTATGGDDGWNLVGNPYPASISWDNGWSRSNIAAAIAIPDNGSGGRMLYYDPGVTEDEIPNGEIALGQGFWVRATGENPQLTITEEAKVTGVAEFFRKGKPFIPSFALKLSRGADADRAYVKTVEGAKGTLDPFDAPKIGSAKFTVSVISEDNRAMAINALEQFTCGYIMNLGTANLTVGSYQFDLDTRGFFQEFRFVLADAYTKNEIELGSGSYAFSVNSDAASAAYNRFTIRVEEGAMFNAVSPVQASACAPMAEVTLADTEPVLTYAIFNASGKKISSAVAGNGGVLTIAVPFSELDAVTTAVSVLATSACTAERAVSGVINLVKDNPLVTSVKNEFACLSGSVNLVAEANASGAAFEWFGTATGGVAIGSGSTFTTPVLDKNKTYYVEAISGLGCRSERTAILTDITTFEMPELIVEGNWLKSTYPNGNQWYFEGKKLQGKTGAELFMTRPGVYELRVEVSSCTFSFPYVNEKRGLQFFPNPVDDQLFMSGIDEDVTRIDIANTMGQTVIHVYEKGRNFDGDVRLTNLPDGLYLLVVTKAGEKLSYRITKEKK